LKSHAQRILPFSLGLRQVGQRAGTGFMEIIREVVREQPKLEWVAKLLGISPELLSHALKSQRAFHAEWVPSLLPVDHGHRLVRYLAYQSHLRVVPVELFNNADWREASESVLREAGQIGDQLRQQILEAAQLAAEKRSSEDDG
jgi:uncharacterized membrane protein YccC